MRSSIRSSPTENLSNPLAYRGGDGVHVSFRFLTSVDSPCEDRIESIQLFAPQR